MQDKSYISCADTAKLVRQALKEAFPGHKFSVRSSSYSGGASIDIQWTDGPTDKQVESISNAFEGSYFDGMIDYKGSVYAKLDGKPVHFGANFIHTRREFSDALVQRAIDAIASKYAANFTAHNIPVPTVADYNDGKLYNVHLFGATWNCGGPDTLQSLISFDCSKRTRIANPMPSPTLARVSANGDDGYGAGTVGQDGSGGGRGYSTPERIRAARDADAMARAELAAMPVGGRA